jgi:hypothetical protein
MHGLRANLSWHEVCIVVPEAVTNNRAPQDSKEGLSEID